MISNPGGRVPCDTRIDIGLLVIGLVYVIACSTHKLSSVVNINPAGVVKYGAAVPDIVIVNVLSLIAVFVRCVAVALTTKVDIVSCFTVSGVPEISPSVAKLNPAGKLPLIN